MPYKDNNVRREREQDPAFKAKKLAYMRDVYYPKKRAERLAYMKQYQEKNRDRLVEYGQTYYEKNHDVLMEKAKEYRESHKADNLAWRAANHEHLKKSNEEYRANNPEKIKAYKAQYLKDHPEESRHWTSTRRARKVGNGGSHTLAQWIAKVDLLGFCCTYCGVENVPLHKDHKVPLSRGGSDDITNITPACQPCNNRKGSKTAHEFIGIP